MAHTTLSKRRETHARIRRSEQRDAKGYDEATRRLHTAGLLLVVGIIGMLIGSVARSRWGTEDAGTEGLAESDDNSLQTALDTYNNRLVTTLWWPEQK